MSKFPKMPVTRANDSNRLRGRDALAFLTKELAKVDSKLLEPLDATLWPRDMPVKTGGGFIENIAAISVEYASTGGPDGSNNLIFNGANDIPVMQADFDETVWRVFNWAEYWTLGYIESEKFKKTARNAEEILNKGIHKHFDAFCDQNVYKGFSKVNSTGLLNNANVTRVSAANNAGGTSTAWEDKTADEILEDINTVLTGVWAANEMAENALPNHILIPVEQFGALVTRKVGTTGDKSILTYIKENNITSQQGKELSILPCKYCKSAGQGSTDRLIAYINHADMVEYEMTQPLKRWEMERSNLAIKTPFVAQISEVKFKYPTTVRYMDGI
jgi:hypothetical protein